MSEEPRVGLLNPSQRLIVGFAITTFALLGSMAMGISALIVLGQLVRFFSSVLWPLAVAGVFALVLRPLIDLLEIRLRLHRMWAVVVLYAVVVLFLTSALVLAVPPLIAQVLNFIDYIPKLSAQTTKYFEENYPAWAATAREKMENPIVRDMVDSLTSTGKSLITHSLPALRSAGGGLLGVFAFIAHLAIIPVYLFFFLLVRGEPTKNLPGHLTFVKPSLRDDIVFLVREFINIIESFFRGQLIIGLIMGVLLGIGFTLVGLRFGFVIGLSLGVLNIIPYLGTIIGLAVTIPLAFFQKPQVAQAIADGAAQQATALQDAPSSGGMQLVMLVLLVKMIVQAIESWLLTPRIMGSRTGLHPVIIIIAIFFWGTAFQGILGMLLAIPLTAFFVTAWRLAKWKYFTSRADTIVSV
ncbi:MAG: AI-2E family transporter [Opitutaceae bacterium]